MRDTRKSLSLDEVREIVAWARGSGLGELELEQPGLRLRFVFPALADLHVVTTKTAGRFLQRHPARQGPFVRTGDRVDAGDIVGLVQFEHIYRPVITSRAGVLARFLVEPESSVDVGAAIAEIATATEERGHGTRS